MRTIKLYTLSATASLLLAGIAHADDSVLFGQGGYAAQSTHQTVNASQQLARNVETHWTSRIGTGTASAVEAGKVTAENSSGVRAQSNTARYPAPYWASLIGTGTAAKF